MKNSEVVTLILAGGKGERLGVLTNEMPKSAITFGGVHRLIDFALSNCRHSKVGNVGIVTQYRGRYLADYIGCGSQWLPECRSSNITVLPHRVRDATCESFSGTADAVLMNCGFIEAKNPKNVLVITGDHVYRMDYSKVLKTHEESGAAATIAAVNVPLLEASRFGIILTDKKNAIIDYKEKPLIPKSYLASMGVYVFNWAALKKHLLIASASSKSSLDIGRDIIPRMMITGQNLVAHRFHGYWKELDNIFCLWETSMELLSPSPGIDLYDDNWKVIGRNKSRLIRHKLTNDDNASISDSLVAEGADIKGTVTKSIVSADVEIGKDARIIDSVIMPGAKIGKGSVVLKAIIGSGATVEDYTAIGCVRPDGKYLDNYRGVSAIGGNAKVSTCRAGLLKTTPAQ